MSPPRSFIGTFALWLGILWPSFTLAFELSTRACAGTFFDPLPTWWHLPLLLPVPLACLCVWWIRRKGSGTESAWVTFLVRAAWPPVLFYGLVFLPLSLMAVIFLPMTIVHLGQVADTEAAFLPALILATLGPAMGLIGLSTASGSLSRLQAFSPTDRYRQILLWRRRGWMTGWFLLLVAEAPLVWSHVWLEAAENHSFGTLPLKALRASGSHTMMLRAAYEGRPSQAFGPSMALINFVRSRFFYDWLGRGQLTQMACRETYYRVTGKPFNDLPPPRRNQIRLLGRTEAAADNSLDGFGWDDERGGDKVGARLKGLSLASSEMVWHADKESALAQGEWTLEFSNRHRNAQEARCQILLPPGACVSRLNLWLPGQAQPQEAAFGTTQQVKAAYTKVVVVDRRDPVMVNMVGPDRVMTQCFPVPPGGTMKIRLGITAPCDESTRGKLYFPMFLERNFSVPETLKHSVTISSNGSISVVIGDGSATVPLSAANPWKTGITTAELNQFRLQMEVPSAISVWAKDPFATKDELPFLQRTREPVWATTAQRVIVVVDASITLRPHAHAIRDALLALPASLQVTVILSTDDGEPQVLTRDSLAAELDARAFDGGRNSLPAIELALRHYQESKVPAALFWLHGPQPWDFLAPSQFADQSGTESTPALVPAIQSLHQQLKKPGLPDQRSFFHTLSLYPGANRLLESLHRTGSFSSDGRWEGTVSGLGNFFTTHSSGHETWQHTTLRLAHAPAGVPEVGDQLVRHDTFVRIMSAFQGEHPAPAAEGKLATRYQLVTPYSGAVVLETKEQFDAASLVPIDPSAAPLMPSGVPEPTRVVLMVLGLAAWILQRRRGRG